MVWFILLHLVGFVVDLLTATRRTDRDKDLEILLLRHQLQVLQRQRPQPLRLTRWEKLTLAVLTAKLARITTGPRTALDQVLLLFKPETVLKWHRELVRRKWTVRRPHAGGRPATPADVEALLLRLARDNPGWGYSRIHGELTKLGYIIGRSTVRDILQRHGVSPARERQRQSSTRWRVGGRHCCPRSAMLHSLLRGWSHQGTYGACWQSTGRRWGDASAGRTCAVQKPRPDLSSGAILRRRSPCDCHHVTAPHLIAR